jgi:hypothetical protein
MKHIIFGLLAIALGVWGIVRQWWAFLDLLNVVIPILLVLVGVVALAAGISGQLKTEAAEEAPAQGQLGSRSSHGGEGGSPSR